MKSQGLKLATQLLGSVRDLAPVVLVVAFFQLVVLQQPLPDLTQLLTGLLMVVVGLGFFIRGLEMGLFPIGESMAHAFARKGSVFWLLLFAFALGFGTTIAEPALIAIAGEAAEVAAQGNWIDADEASMSRYATELRLTVAFSVGFAIVVGVLRILKGWPIQFLIIGGYLLVVLMTAMAPPEIIGIAYDSGGVTTSTITVPLVTALGVGLATAIRERNPMLDGFGLIAFASLMPMIFRHGIRNAPMIELLSHSLNVFLGTVRDVLPIVAIIVGFRLFVLRRRIANLKKVITGFVYVIIGLAFFLIGLEEALFPLGRSMAQQLTDPAFVGISSHWTQYYWVYAFAFAIGFATTIAEPALIAVAIKANEVSAGSVGIWGLRSAVALGVGFGIALGAYRIVIGAPLQYFIMAGYIVVVVQTIFAPRMIIPLAYDSGGVTTSTVTVPLVAALGLGLAENVPGRSALLDGFGLISFASLFPIISVMAYAQITQWLNRRDARARKGDSTDAASKHAAEDND